MIGALDRTVAFAGELARYVELHVRSSRAERSACDPRSDLVVSLSTVPRRVGMLLPTIRSLLDQTLRPASILVAVPRFSRRERRPYSVPEDVRGHAELTVVDVDVDEGPATKLLPALRRYREEPSRKIVVVDDDNVYPRNFLRTLSDAADEHPNAAVALRGWNAPSSLEWRDVRPIFGSSIETARRIDVITGCGGFLVRPGFFDDRIFALEAAAPHAYYSDDVWISGHLAMREVPAYVVPLPRTHVYLNALATWRAPGLDQNENRAGVHDAALLERFAASWPSLRRYAASPGPHAR